MLTKFACKLALKGKPKPIIQRFANDRTEETKNLLDKILNTKELFNENKSFILGLVDYYTRKKYFTDVQFKALGKLIYG